MRYIFYILLSISSHMMLAQANFKFEKTEHNFGTVTEGKDTLWCEFKFVNNGDEPLLISDVKTSCECTLAEWPKHSIAPGKSAYIRGGFKIEGKSGLFSKNIILIANTTPATTILTMKGQIVPAVKQ